MAWIPVMIIHFLSQSHGKNSKRVLAWLQGAFGRETYSREAGRGQESLEQQGRGLESLEQQDCFT